MLLTSAAPVIVSVQVLTRMAEIHDAVVAGVRVAVQEWYRTEGKLLPLDPRAVRVLRRLAGMPYDAIGTVRPDILHSDRDHRLLVCEINARFPLNGFLVSALAAHHLHERSMSPESLYAQLQLSAVSPSLGLLDALRARFDVAKPVFILHKAETAHDLEIVDRVLDLKVIHCVPTDLAVSSNGSLIVNHNGLSVTIEQVMIELTQDELLNLSEPVLDAIADLSARGKSLNDLRTIFIAHDKRLLAVLCDAHRQLPQLDSNVANTLSQCIVPTLLASQFTRPFPFSHSTVLKPCSLGKGVGIIMEHTCKSATDFIYHVHEAAQNEETRPFVVQPYIEQPMVKAQDATGTLHNSLRLVGTLLSLDGIFYGPGVYRASPSELVALGRGGLALFPMTPLMAIPSDARVFAKTLQDVDAAAVRKAIAHHGVALVGLGCKIDSSERRQFQSLVMEDLQGRPRQHNGKASDFVWDISVQSKVSLENGQQACQSQHPPLARSQTDEEFDVHTDSSFEDPPPRCVVLAVLRGDRRGGGLSSFASVQKVLATLKASIVAVLRRTLVRWTVPPEFLQTQNG
ncbi:UNVERIFIED_CONTAM: hypothetical protein HDU68_011692, partial [Siphonaria sp. JEL0065]